MSDFDYPPSTTVTLSDELDQLQRRAEDGNEANDTHIEALEWAINEFGADATVCVQGMTTTKRDRTVDTANRVTMGPLGASALRTWLVAASITEAPWLEGGEDLEEQQALLGALPPSVSDWLDAQVEDINDLSEGN